MAKKPTMYSAFSGAGLMALGHAREGFKIVGGFDIDPWAVKTFHRNFPKSDIECGSIVDADFVNIVIEKYHGKIDAIEGGSPCQSFSMSGNRDTLERRAYFFLDFLEFVKRMDPVVFVFENVKAFTSMKIVSPDSVELTNTDVVVKDSSLAKYLAMRRHLRDLKRFAAQREISTEETIELKSLEEDEFLATFKPNLVSLLDTFVAKASENYALVHGIVNATQFGSGQNRERFICIGVKKGFNILPSLPEKIGKPLTARDVIGDLENAPENALPNHEFTRHSPSQVRKMQALAYGERVYRFNDAWRRLDPDKPAYCQKEDHGGSSVHYLHPRVVTCREMARIQGVADDFVFLGPKCQVMKQIGNGVDGHMARAIARTIKAILDKKS